MSNPLLNVTDFRKTWVDGYNRQTNQLKQYHDQLTLRDQQEEKARTTNTPVQILNQLADTVNKGTTTFLKFDELAGQKVQQKLVEMGLTGSSFDVLRMLEEHDGNEAAIHKEYKNYAGLISSLPPGAKEHLKSLHGRNLYWAKAYLTQQKSLELDADYKNLLAYEGSDETIIAERDKLTLDLNQYTDNHPGRKAVLSRWASRQLGDEFLSDGILVKYAAENISKFVNMKDIQNLHKTTKVSNVQSEIDLQTKIQTARASGPELLQQTAIQEIDILEAGLKNVTRTYTDSGVIIDGVYIDGITNESSDRTIARNLFANKLIKLSNGDQLLTQDLDNMFEDGVLRGAPQGDSIGNFFTEAELAPIYDAANRATVRAGLRAEAAKKKQNQNLVLKALAENSGDNWNKDNLQIVYNKLELNEATKEQLQTIENAMNSNNSQESYIEDATTYKPYEVEGYLGLDDDTIEAIPNITLRNEIQTEKNDLITAHEAAKIPLRTESQISRYLGGADVTTFEKLTLHGEAVNVKIHLLKKVNEFSKIGQKKFKYKGDELANFVTTELQKYWTANGGDHTTASLKNYKGPALESKKFVKNINGGTYDNFKSWRVDDYKKRHELRVSLQKASTPLTQEQTTNISNGIKKQFFALGGYDVPDARMKIIDKKGSVITTGAALQIMLLNQEYSQDFLVKCKVLGMPPAVVFEHQVEAIREAAKNGDEDAIGTVNALNLDQVEIPDNEADFWKGINDNLDHPHIAEISNLLTTKGWENLTAKQKARVGFSFLNDDFSNTEIFANGVPLRIGGYDSRAHEIRTDEIQQKELSDIEQSGQEWGPGGQPSASEILKLQEKNRKKVEKGEEQLQILENNMNFSGTL